MHSNQPLDFPSIAYGTHQTKHDLRILAYPGAAALRHDVAILGLNDNSLGAISNERMPLLIELHAALDYQLQLGKSVVYVINMISRVRAFYAWSDSNNLAVTHESASDCFYQWVEHWIHRVTVEKNITQLNAWRFVKPVDNLLSKILDVHLGLLRNTRLTPSTRKMLANPKKSDKTNLADAFHFGNALLDIVDALATSTVYGELPITISLRDGNTLTEWCGLRSPEIVKSLTESTKDARRIAEAREKWAREHTPRTRHTVINLRIEAELLIFISQTSMNLAQALTYPRGDFRYQSSDDGINVFRAYKGRRSGEVEFRIYKDYAEVFKRYLNWLSEIFDDDDDRLFPFHHPHKIPSNLKKHAFQAIERRLRPLGYVIFKPTALRSLKINWLLRKSLAPSLVAEMAQHTELTLLRVYEKPHHQIASLEIARFHNKMDPSNSAAGPGACLALDTSPSPLVEVAPESPEPDCINPIGCLFCEFHRDVDSQDYVWTLTTLRHCKKIELDTFTPPTKDALPHPAHAAIQRISKKLQAFSESSEIRAMWVVEANNRMLEGKYHPTLAVTIQMMEALA